MAVKVTVLGCSRHQELEGTVHPQGSITLKSAQIHDLHILDALRIDALMIKYLFYFSSIVLDYI